MPHVCRVCSRLNPDAARYCYHDGAALTGGGQEGPVAVGARPFLAPFVFPSGKACRSFDELVLACEADWDAARDMLQQGFFEGFLGGMGRADLAGAARRAAREPDGDRALDGFLTALPGERQRPLLQVEPREVNLGQVKRGENRSFTLHLENQGMGLLSGNVQSEAPWLALGDAAGAGRKVFQCRHELDLVVHIHGKALRAHPRPQEGRIHIESSGGAVALVVRVEVPLLPFLDGPLAGALTPRQVAEKARTAPREAAGLFENGSVARWYDSNGWTYPVQGPAASGMAAVQQFFEALGLTKPPRVQLTQNKVALNGAPGGNVEAFLFVESPENRPVYAHAVSETSWLHIGKVRSQGNSARIHLHVPAVPARPGEKLHGKAIISANGGQRFPIDVTLTIQGSPGWGAMEEPAALPAGPTKAKTKTAHDPPPVRREADSKRSLSPEPIKAVAEWLDSERGRGSVVLEAPPPTSSKSRVKPSKPPLEPRLSTPSIGDVSGGRLGEETPSRGDGLLHLLPLAALLLLLLGAVVHDLRLASVVGSDGEEEGAAVLVDPTPLLALRFNDGAPADGLPGGTMSFGLGVLQPPKRLMFDPLGRTNNVCVRIDGMDYLFGQADLIAVRPGELFQRQASVARWVAMQSALGKDSRGRTRDGARSVWEVVGLADRPCQVQVTQTVEIVPGEQSGRLDTCLVRYGLHNTDRVAHDVGIRFLLDTYIGDNDGVPFTIPGQTRLCSTRQKYDGADAVPDYIQALENENLLNPGTVAHLQFKLPGRLESPSRVLLGGYPDGPLRTLGYPLANGWFTPWDVPFVNIRELVDRQAKLREKPLRPPEPDSAVTLYWDIQRLDPGQRREVGFAYGLGQVASAEGEGKLLLTVGGRTERDGEFTLTALRASPLPGEKLTLSLPAGDRFELLSPAEQAAPAVEVGSVRPISTVTWRLKARQIGSSTLVVRSSAGVRQKQRVRIIPRTQGVLD